MEIREDALSALACKRANIDGAALFCVIPRQPDCNLLKLLATYQIMWDFLDCASEHGASAGQISGRQLHLALVDAIDSGRAVSDYYRYHPWREDGGYLRALVETCRECCRRLPSHERVRRLLVRDAYRANVQAINHELDLTAREADLQEWAAREFPAGHEANWFELAGAAGAALSIYALLALGAQSACREIDVIRIHGAYFPWVSAAATMLDSYVDQADDLASGDHVYVGHYSKPEHVVPSVGRLVRRGLREARRLPDGERHIVIVACMTAMYLSRDSARTESMRESTQSLVHAGGSLTRLLLPVLRLWRVAYSQQSE